MLELSLRLTDPDDLYAALIAAYDGLSEAESHAMNARLILILGNQIGDASLVAEAIALARRTGPPKVQATAEYFQSGT